jgi:beta-carotene 3-hydroxylase
MTSVLLAVGSFALMEPLAALVHRGLMHGRGWAWHRSHHQHPRPGWEVNDLFPVVMGTATFLLMLIGQSFDQLRPLLWVGAGLTAYGIAYLVVHDLLVHQRLGPLPLANSRYIDRVARAHARHHARAGPPYGFLVPIGAAEPAGGDAVVTGVVRPMSARAATRTLVAVGTRTRAEKTS